MNNIISNIISAIIRKIKHFIQYITRPLIHHVKKTTSDNPWEVNPVATTTKTSVSFPPPPSDMQPIFKDLPEKKLSRFPNIKKRHVPIIRTFKRWIAGILIILNFIISQFVLGWGQNAQVFMLFFLANALILIDYLWKTRHTDEPFKKEKIS